MSVATNAEDNNRLDRIENTLGQLTTVVLDLATQASDVARHQKQRSQEIESLLRVAQAHQASMETLQDSMTTMQSGVTAMQSGVTTMQSSVTAMQSSVGRMESGIEAMRANLQAVQAQQQRHEEEMEKLRLRQAESDERFNVLLEEVRYLIRRLGPANDVNGES